jgi:hypothetical protein
MIVMEQITILVRDEGKARSLMDLLRSLDFVSILDIENVEPSTKELEEEASREEEFFAAAGIWKDRDITVESLRAAAWPRQTK